MMRQGGNGQQGGNKRGRGRGPGGGPQHGGGNNNGGGNRRPQFPNRNQNFDSNGPDVRIRGSAYQVHEKYLNLARDATAAGDRIMAESYYQHAEHYYRIINVQEYGPEDGRRQRNDYNNGGQNNWNGDNQQSEFGGEGEGDQNEQNEQPEIRDTRPPRNQPQEQQESQERQEFNQNPQTGRNEYEFGENDQPE